MLPINARANLLEASIAQTSALPINHHREAQAGPSQVTSREPGPHFGAITQEYLSRHGQRRLSSTEQPLGTRQVQTGTDRERIQNKFGELNQRGSEFAGKPRKEQAEIVSRATGYTLAGVEKTLEGQGTRRVRGGADRERIQNKFGELNQRGSEFAGKTRKEQAEIVSRATGYALAGVEKTLEGQGTRQVQSGADRERIQNKFGELNQRGSEFAGKPRKEQAEIVSRATGYTLAGVEKTLEGQGTRRVQSGAAEKAIQAAFTQRNQRGSEFAGKTRKEQAEIVSRATGYTLGGVEKTLEGQGTRQVRGGAAEKAIQAAFTQRNQRGSEFAGKTRKEQAEIVSRATGYALGGVEKTLEGQGTRQVQTGAAEKAIQAAFTQRNQRGSEFAGKTRKEQAEIVSRATGYALGGVEKTLEGQGTRQVRGRAAEKAIQAAFTQRNQRGSEFAGKTRKEQAEIVSRATGYSLGGVEKTLEGQGTRRVQSGAAEKAIQAAFTQRNQRGSEFAGKTRKEQAEIVSRATGYALGGVEKTLEGQGTRQVQSGADRERIQNKFGELNQRGSEFAGKTRKEQAEIVSRATGYTLGGVEKTLEGAKNNQIVSQNHFPSGRLVDFLGQQRALSLGAVQNGSMNAVEPPPAADNREPVMPELNFDVEAVLNSLDTDGNDMDVDGFNQSLASLGPVQSGSMNAVEPPPAADNREPVMPELNFDVEAFLNSLDTDGNDMDVDGFNQSLASLGPVQSGSMNAVVPPLAADNREALMPELNFDVEAVLDSLHADGNDMDVDGFPTRTVASDYLRGKSF